MYQDVENSIEY